jgi:hypothetical protein
MGTASTAISTFDQRRFFDKALSYGVAQGLISPERCTTIQADLAKGVVQIANYFGTAYLRPDLELALIRTVNLISLYLEDLSKGDIHIAAQSLQNNTLLSHSKKGADLLRNIAGQAQNTLLIKSGGISLDEQQSYLNIMSSQERISWPQYQADLREGQLLQSKVDLGFWLAKKLKLASDDICDAESLILSSMLMLYAKGSDEKPLRRADYDRYIKIAKKKSTTLNAEHLAAFFKEAPTAIQISAQAEMNAFIQNELPKIKTGNQHVESYYLRGGHNEISLYDQAIADNWQRLTGLDSDSETLATLLLFSVCELPFKAAMLKREAIAITQYVRDHGFNAQALAKFIDNHVPMSQREEINDFWQNDLKAEAEAALANKDPQYPDLYMERALRYLQQRCNAKWKGRA